MKTQTITRALIVLLIVIPIALVACKLTFWDYSFEKTLSRTSYRVHFQFQPEATADTVKLRVDLPTADDRQLISAEANHADGYNTLILKGENGRYASWNGKPGPNNILSWSFEFIGYAHAFELDTAQLLRNVQQPVHAAAQPNYPAAARFNVDFDALYRSDNKAVTALETIFAQAEQAQHPTDELVGLARAADLPARYVGGFDLGEEDSEFRHWVEILIGEQWIPFDPEKKHFARIPAAYLKINHGRTPTAPATANVQYAQSVEVRQTTAISPELLAELPEQPLNAFTAWKAFETAGIPLDILKVILLLPLGALVVALFRNVIGIATFGIFLPALIAMASRETGFFWGVLAFLLVILVVSGIHFALERWNLLSVPKLAILLVSVTMVFLLVSLIGVTTGMTSLAYVALFPIVVVTISAERFAKTIVQESYPTALKLTLQTLLVAGAAYIVMSSSTVESMFLTFPELFMVIIAVNLILGQWIGLRMSELFRFNWIVT